MEGKTLPRCGDCFFGYTRRCGGHTTISPEALKLERAGEPVGIGCFGQRKGEFVFDLYGWPEPRARFRPIPKLPVFVPQITTAGLKSIPPYPEQLDTFAVSLTTVFTPHGKLRWIDPASLRRALRLPPTSKLLLVGCTSDALLEKIWRRSKQDHIWERLAGLGLEAATGFSFSVWDVQPRFDQIMNQRRNELSCLYLAERGIPSIPILFWYERYDYREMLRWLRGNPTLRTIGIHAQFIRKGRRFEMLWRDMERLRNDLKSDPHFVLIGIGDRRRIGRLVSNFSCTIVAAAPFALATRAGIAIGPDLVRGQRPERRLTREELVAANIRQYLSFCARCVRRHLHRLSSIRPAQVSRNLSRAKASSRL